MLKIQTLLQNSLLLVIAGSSFALSACDNNHQGTPTQLANPASVYCDQAGGKHIVKRDDAGNEAGYCEFSDGQQCDEWALFRGQCVPDLAINKPFEWCSQGMNSPIMSNPDLGNNAHSAMLPADLLKPMVDQGLATPEMPISLLQASRWRCMTGNVWVCMVGANLPCGELADLSRTPSDKINEFCQANAGAEVIPAYVTGRATVYEWTCNNTQPVAGKQFVEADAAGYLSNIWYQLEP